MSAIKVDGRRAYDLVRAGEQVELSISYISDWGTQGLGVFLDDANPTLRYHVDPARVASQRLVHRVVDDFLRQVIGPGGVGIHARAALDRVQPGQDFDIFGVVTTAHGAHCKGTEQDYRGGGPGQAGKSDGRCNVWRISFAVQWFPVLKQRPARAGEVACP